MIWTEWRYILQIAATDDAEHLVYGRRVRRNTSEQLVNVYRVFWGFIFCPCFETQDKLGTPRPVTVAGRTAHSPLKWTDPKLVSCIPSASWTTAESVKFTISEEDSWHLVFLSKTCTFCREPDMIRLTISESHSCSKRALQLMEDAFTVIKQPTIFC